MDTLGRVGDLVAEKVGTYSNIFVLVPFLVPLLLLLRRLKTLLRRFKTRLDALRRVLMILR